MPEIIRCPECGRETYLGLAACPHCGADIPPDVAPDSPRPRPPETDRRGPGAATFPMFVARTAIFNFLYYATIAADEGYTRYKYGADAMPLGAHPAGAMLIIGGFFVLNLIYFALEGSFWNSMRRVKPAVSLLFPPAAYVAIVSGIILLRA